MQVVERLLRVMATLRHPEQGCPWDRKQNFATIAPYTLEEAYEVADAIDRQDYIQLKDELGDLLFQVVYHAQLAAEQHLFDFADVALAVTDKMVARHPHVFAEAQFNNEEEIKTNWEQQKALERQQYHQDNSVLAGVALVLPALRRAEKLQKRAAHVGFDWSEVEPVFDKLHEEISELQDARHQNDAARLFEEMGDILFTCVNLARHLGVNAEEALRAGNRKFEQRFRRMEALLAEQEKSISECDLHSLDEIWTQVKREET